jgi:hypothetical protein
MFLLSTIQTRRSKGNGRFYLFEPIDAIETFIIRQVLFG